MNEPTPLLRIAQVAPPVEAVPPAAYGGTERVVYELFRGLHDRGHRVTTFASGDSDVPGELVATVDKALRADGFTGDPGPHFRRTIELVMDHLDDFDVVHLHLDSWAAPILRQITERTVGLSTFHSRRALPWARTGLAEAGPGIVAISESQAL